MVYFIVLFFKQKTAYEMRISDWSSDVCSSDLQQPARGVDRQRARALDRAGGDERPALAFLAEAEALQRHDHAVGEAVVDLRDVHVLGPEAGAPPQVRAEERGVRTAGGRTCIYRCVPQS